jgi:hypothetical protein
VREKPGKGKIKKMAAIGQQSQDIGVGKFKPTWRGIDDADVPAAGNCEIKGDRL